MPTQYQEKTRPDYSRLMREGQKDQDKERAKTPEQEEVLESSETIKEQIDQINQKIDKDIAENQETSDTRMESAIQEAQTGEPLAELPELQKQAQQELSKATGQLENLASQVKRKLRESAKDKEPGQVARMKIQNIFSAIDNLQEKQVSDDNIITRERREFLDKIKQDLEDLANPELIEDLKQEHGEAWPGELIRGVEEQSWHIITEQDKQEIQSKIEELELIKEDVAEAMASANQKLDQIDKNGLLETYNSLIRDIARQKSIPETDPKAQKNISKKIENWQKKLEKKGINQEEQAKQIKNIIELKQQAGSNQKSFENTENEIDFQQSLIQEREKIEELIKIGSITEPELNQLKKTYQQTIEQLDQMIPEEVKQRAEKDAGEIQREIEAMIANSRGDMRAELLKKYKNLVDKGIDKIFKYDPEHSSQTKTKILKGIKQAALWGGTAAAIMIVGNFMEGFGGVEEAGAANTQEDFDLQKEYPNLKEHIESGELTLEETQALLREGFEDVGEGQLEIGDPENPKIAEILLKSVIKEEYGVEDVDLTHQSEQVQKFIQHESVNEYVEDALEDDLEETREFIENNPERQAWFNKAVDILNQRLIALETQAIKEGMAPEIIANVQKMQTNAEDIIRSMCAAVDIADNPDLMKQVKFFTDPELMSKISFTHEQTEYGGWTSVPESYLLLNLQENPQTGDQYMMYGGTYKMREQGKMVIAQNNKSYDLMVDVFLHEMCHDAFEDDTAVRIGYGRTSGDVAQQNEPIAEWISERAAKHLGLQHEEVKGESLDKALDEVYDADASLKGSKARIGYAKRIARITPVFEMIKPEMLKVYTGAMSPEEFKEQLPDTFEAWGINAEDSELLAQNLVKFNSIKNPATEKIVDDFLQFAQTHNAYLRFANPNAPGGYDNIPISEKFFKGLFSEILTGDLLLNALDDNMDQQSKNLILQLKEKIVDRYPKEIESILKRNLSDQQVESIMAGADLDSAVKNLVNSIDWDKE